MGKKVSKGHCVVLYDKVIDSDAWKEISGNAVKIYIQLLRKRYMKFEGKGKKKTLIGDNANDLSLTQKQVKELWNMDKRALKKGIDELIEKGFIELISPGFIRLTDTCIRQKLPNIYGLSNKFLDYVSNKV